MTAVRSTTNKTMPLMLATAVLAAGVAMWAGWALATPGMGNKSSTNLSSARMDELLNLQTSGPSRVLVESSRYGSGATSGWHSHPGPHVISVTSGALTVYRADDPSCAPRVFGPGQAFTGGNTHFVSNDGTVDATYTVTAIYPEGAGTWSDAPAPAHCPPVTSVSPRTVDPGQTITVSAFNARTPGADYILKVGANPDTVHTTGTVFGIDTTAHPSGVLPPGQHVLPGSMTSGVRWVVYVKKGDSSDHTVPARIVVI